MPKTTKDYTSALESFKIQGLSNNPIVFIMGLIIILNQYFTNVFTKYANISTPTWLTISGYQYHISRWRVILLLFIGTILRKKNKTDIIRDEKISNQYYAIKEDLSPFGINEENKEGVKNFIKIGRNKDIDKIEKALLDGNFTVGIFSGESGVGKTSLLNAGLIPILKAKTSQKFVLVTFTNTDKPMDSIINAIKDVFKTGDTIKNIENLNELINKITSESNVNPPKLILIFDQLEQLFFQTPTSTECKDFFKQLNCLIKKGKVKLLISIRSDFEDCLKREIRVGDSDISLETGTNYFVLKKFTISQVINIIKYVNPVYGNESFSKENLKKITENGNIISPTDLQILLWAIKNKPSFINTESLIKKGDISRVLQNFLECKLSEEKSYTKNQALSVLLALIDLSDKKNSPRQLKLSFEELTQKLKSEIDGNILNGILNSLEEYRLIHRIPKLESGDTKIIQYQLARVSLIAPIINIRYEKKYQIKKILNLLELKANELFFWGEKLEQNIINVKALFKNQILIKVFVIALLVIGGVCSLAYNSLWYKMNYEIKYKITSKNLKEINIIVDTLTKVDSDETRFFLNNLTVAEEVKAKAEVGYNLALMKDNPEKALEIVKTMDDSDSYKAKALAEIVKSIVKGNPANNYKKAKDIAYTIKDNDTKTEVLVYIAKSLVENDNLKDNVKEAKKIADTIKDDYAKVKILTHIAETLHKFDMNNSAVDSLHQKAENIAYASNVDIKVKALTHIAESYNKINDNGSADRLYNDAIEIAKKLNKDNTRANSLVGIAESLVKVNPDEESIQKAVNIAKDIYPSEFKQKAYANIAESLARINPNKYDSKIENYLEEINDEKLMIQKIYILTQLAEGLKPAKDKNERVQTHFRRAIFFTMNINDNDNKVKAIKIIAKSLAKFTKKNSKMANDFFENLSEEVEECILPENEKVKLKALFLIHQKEYESAYDILVASDDTSLEKALMLIGILADY